jgi:hypothetical protein
LAAKEEDVNVIRWKVFGRNLRGLFEAKFFILTGMNAKMVTRMLILGRMCPNRNC